MSIYSVSLYILVLYHIFMCIVFNVQANVPHPNRASVESVRAQLHVSLYVKLLV